MRSRMKIGTKLMVIGFFLILIPLMIVGTIAIIISSSALTEAADELLGSRSKEIAQRVDDVLKDQLRFTTALTVTPHVVSTAAMVDSGEGTESEQNMALLNDYLKQIIQTENLGNNVQLIGLVNMAGTIIAATDPKYRGVKVPDRTYFKIARSGKPTIGEVAINKVTHEPFLSFASPVRTADGKVVGVVIYIYSAGFLNDLIADERIGKTGYAFVIDQTGLLIAHPNPAHRMKTNLVHSRGMEAFVKMMIDGQAGVSRYIFEGVSKTAGFAPIPSTGWSLGLTMPDEEYLAAVSRMAILIFFAGTITILLATGGFFVFAYFLVKRLKRSVDFAGEMSSGNLTGTVEDHQSDEIGILSRSLNGMVSSLSNMIHKIHDGSSSLYVTASELRNVSEVLSVASSNTAGKSDTVAVAAEEMNSNIESMAAAMEEASANVDNIAAAVEEMNASFSEITGRLNRTRESANRAAQASTISSSQVTELDKAAIEIESITETIYTIADKTSLLALNATIEAARAGDAGKGFAVVAGEIKILAQQVSDSTGDIARKIGAIQATTGTVIAGIRDIVEVIAEVNESVDSIAVSMQQQNQATREISENISQTSIGIREINENVTQTSQAVDQVTAEVSEVNQAMNDMRVASGQVEKNADDLMEIAKQLENRVLEFRVNESGFSSSPVKLAHSAWKKKLSELLSGRSHLEVSDISSHKECEFGKWYFGEGIEKYKNMKTFKAIDPHHAKIHDTAKEITRLFNSGKTDEATHLFSKFSGLTENLFQLLDELEQETEAH